MCIRDSYIGYFPSLSLAENCCDQSQDIIQYLIDSDDDLENDHPQDLLAAIHQFHSQDSYHDSLEELVEEETNQEIEENPQDLSEGTSDDSPSLLGEAQENIQPQNHPSKEKENYCTSIQRKKKMPPLLIEEEINQMLNI